MTVQRGDVVLARFPHAGGGRGKKRPVVVVQSDVYNTTRSHALVAEVTTNLTDAGDPAHLLIEVATADGAATGLAQDSLVSCLFVAPITTDRIDRTLGRLSAALLARLDDCLKAAMNLH
jgi:mRNA interferase MazF